MLLLPCLWTLAASVGFAPTAAEADFADMGTEENSAPEGLPQELKGMQRIYNGVEALPGQFPHYVLLIIDEAPKKNICGGSILTDQWVVTVAHCVTRSAPRSVIVVAGYLAVGVNETYSQWSRSNGIFIHPQWDSHNYDAALIRVRPKLLLGSPLVRAIRIPEPGENLALEMLLSFVGFGNVDNSGTKPEKLLYTKGELTTKQICRLRPEETLECAKALSDIMGGTTCPNTFGGGVVGAPSDAGIYLVGLHIKGTCQERHRFYFIPFSYIASWVQSIIY